MEPEFTDDQLRIICEILMPYMPKEMQWDTEITEPA